MLALHRSALAALTLSPAAAADVLVVDVAGSPYASIQAAVDAAVDGDLILVRANALPFVLVDGKSLTIVVDGGAAVECAFVAVQNLASHQSLSFRGLRSPAGGVGSTVTTPVAIVSCAGAVRFTDCDFEGGAVATTYEVPPTVHVEDAADVAFTNCRITGAHNSLLARPGPGLFVRDAGASLFDTLVHGGDGGDGAPNGQGVPESGFAGAPAIACAGAATLFVSGGSARGGDGGSGWDGDCGPLGPASAGGSGGPAVEALAGPGGVSAIVRVLAPALSGGSGGAGGSNACATAPDGSPGAISVAAVPPLVVAGAARSIAGLAPIRPGESIAFSFRGEPGDRVFLLAAAPRVSLFDPSLHGPQLVATPPRRVQVGTIGASGVLDTTVAAPPLPPGVAANVRSAQALFVDVHGARRVSGTTPLVLLGAGA